MDARDLALEHFRRTKTFRMDLLALSEFIKAREAGSTPNEQHWSIYSGKCGDRGWTLETPKTFRITRRLSTVTSRTHSWKSSPASNGNAG